MTATGVKKEENIMLLYRVINGKVYYVEFVEDVKLQDIMEFFAMSNERFIKISRKR